MDVDEFGRALRAPLATIVLEITHQFLLLGVDRYDRFVRRQQGHGLRVDVAKLRVAIDVIGSFTRLAVGLQAIGQAAQKIADHCGAHLVPLVRQLLHQITQAAAGPQQRPHGIAPRQGLDQRFEITR